MKTDRLAIVLTVINFVILTAILAQSRLIATQSIPQILRVRAFEVVDENGRVGHNLTWNQTASCVSTAG